MSDSDPADLVLNFLAKQNRADAEFGLAADFVESQNDDLLYFGENKQWLVWDGMRWKATLEPVIQARYLAYLDSIRLIVESIGGKERKKAIKHLQKIGNLSCASRVVTWSKGLVLVEAHQLDANPHLITCLSGTLDLRDELLVPHDRGHRITKLAPVLYNPDAEGPIFASFLDRIQPDEEIQVFLQQYLGYSLTGMTDDESMLIAHGDGANGKSSLFESCRKIWGDYAIATAPGALMKQKNSSVPEEIARMRGVRLVLGTELEDGELLHEAKVKQLTSADGTAARFLYGHEFDFNPTGKIIISTNHLPDVKGNDDAIWRRIHLVPFEVQIPLGERDAGVRRAMSEDPDEMQAIFAWGVRGARYFYEGKMIAPDSIRQATAQYREEEDHIQTWLAERTMDVTGARIQSSIAYANYVEWTEDRRLDAVSNKSFSMDLERRGYLRNRTSKAQFILGLEFLGEPLGMKQRSFDH